MNLIARAGRDIFGHAVHGPRLLSLTCRAALPAPVAIGCLVGYRCFWDDARVNGVATGRLLGFTRRERPRLGRSCFRCLVAVVLRSSCCAPPVAMERMTLCIGLPPHIPLEPFH